MKYAVALLRAKDDNNAPPPAQLNPLNTNLVENLATLGKPVDRILPLHGRVVPAADLYAAVGAKPPN